MDHYPSHKQSRHPADKIRSPGGPMQCNPNTNLFFQLQQPASELPLRLACSIMGRHRKVVTFVSVRHQWLPLVCLTTVSLAWGLKFTILIRLSQLEMRLIFTQRAGGRLCCVPWLVERLRCQFELSFSFLQLLAEVLDFRSKIVRTSLLAGQILTATKTEPVIIIKKRWLL